MQSNGLVLLNEIRERSQRIRVAISGDKLHIVVICALHPKSLLGLIRSGKKLFAMRDIDYRVPCSMNDQDGAMYRLDFSQIVESIKGKN